MEKKIRTKDKILQASIELFNRDGERQVTTNHIAAHLGISPGNLYYHFRNKEDIIRHIFKEYVKLLDTRIVPPSGKKEALDMMADYLEAVFELMWRFQFFYLNLPDLLARDPILTEEYLKVQANLLQKVTLILQTLKAVGVLALPDEEIHDLAHAVKMMVTSWVGYLKTQYPGKAVDQPGVYRGVIKVLLLFQPYATELSKTKLSELRQHYESLGRPKSAL